MGRAAVSCSAMPVLVSRLDLVAAAAIRLPKDLSSVVRTLALPDRWRRRR
jgi:hypothetical protein